MMPEIRDAASKLKLSQVVHFLLLLSKARENLQKNANPRISLELLLINMPRLEEKVGTVHSA
jgi:hypothetical protein